MVKEKYTKKILALAVKNSKSYTEVLRHLGHFSASGSTWQHIKKKINNFNIDTSHFLGYRANLGRPSFKRKPTSEILVKGYTHRAYTQQLRRAMFDVDIKHICDICNLGPEWKGKQLTLVIDHIDGKWSNNEKTNLRFLCPNCYSQTETFGAQNIKKYKKNLCKHCNTKITKKAISCLSCHNKKRIRPTKIDWPPTDELTKMVQESNYLAVSRKLGVSDNAIRKRIKNHTP